MTAASTSYRRRMEAVSQEAFFLLSSLCDSVHDEPGEKSHKALAAVFEAPHGTAPKYADLGKVNPGSLILSAEMMLRYLGWEEAADRIIVGLEKTIASKIVTYDFARLMEGATRVKCSEFADQIIAGM